MVQRVLVRGLNMGSALQVAADRAAADASATAAAASQAAAAASESSAATSATAAAASQSSAAASATAADASADSAAASAAEATAIVIADADAAMATAVETVGSDVDTALRGKYSGGTRYASRAAVDTFSGLKRALDRGERSVALQVMSDSTANDSNDWPYQLGLLVAADYPNWTVRWQTWDDTTQLFAAPMIIQTGTGGALYLDGSSGANALRIDSSVSPYIATELDARVKLRLTSWDVDQVLLAKSGAAGQRGWFFSQTSTGSGRPSFTYSTDGTALVTAACNATPVQAAGTDVWLRVTYQGNDGAGNTVVKFYTATDGLTWTQLGSTVTTVGTTSLFDNSTTGVSLGGNTATLAGSRFYEVQVRDGINGPNKVPALPDLWPAITVPASNAVCVGAPTFTVINGGKAGGDIAYLTDPTRLPKLMPNFGQMATVLSQSHNMGTRIGDYWRATWKTFVDTVQPIRPMSPTVALTQNPELSGVADNEKWHARRMSELVAYGTSVNSPVIDTYQAVLDYPGVGGWQAQIISDGAGVHPNATLSTYIAGVVYDAIQAAA